MNRIFYKLRKKGFALWHRITRNESYTQRRADNYSYSVPANVCRQLRQGELCAGQLLTKVDNRRQRQLLRAVCALANDRRNGRAAAEAGRAVEIRVAPGAGRAEAGRAEEIRAFAAENLHYMTSAFLDRIEQVSMASGLMLLAYYIREQNEKLVLESAAGLQNDEFRHAAKLFWVNLKRGGGSGAGIFRDHPAFLAAMEGADEDFAGYVCGKNIAIIGPSSSGTDHSYEIQKDFDIIIRFNYRGAGSLPEGRSGPGTHISYYRKYMNSVFADENEDIGYLADLEYAVLRTYDEAALARAGKYAKARVRREIEGFYFLGKHQLLQLALQDLLFCKPSRIKVFNANCQLTDMKHDDGYYMEKSPLDVLAQWRQYANHNLISQYDYLRQLYKRGIIEADDRLAGILELGTYEYMRLMDAQESKRGIGDVIN